MLGVALVTMSMLLLCLVVWSRMPHVLAIIYLTCEAFQPFLTSSLFAPGPNFSWLCIMSCRRSLVARTLIAVAIVLSVADTLMRCFVGSRSIGKSWKRTARTARAASLVIKNKGKIIPVKDGAVLIHETCRGSRVVAVGPLVVGNWGAD